MPRQRRLPLFASVRDCETDQVVTFLGRLHPIKRLDLLAEAFEIVRKDIRPRKLVIAGPDEGGYRRRVEPLFAPVVERDRWLGALDSDEIAALFAASRVLVQCSDSESFGMSVAEALTAGVPVVATEGSGWTDRSPRAAGISGRMTPPRLRPASYAFSTPRIAPAIRDRAREWARQTFAWNSVARAMCDAYRGRRVSRSARPRIDGDHLAIHLADAERRWAKTACRRCRAKWRAPCRPRRSS